MASSRTGTAPAFAGSNVHRIETSSGVTEETYPATYWPGDSLGDHLEFALKYDGTNLAILAALLDAAPQDEILEYIESRPTGKYARRLWFLCELLTGSTLPLDDLKRGNYIELLDPEQYFSFMPPRRVRRQKIFDNLLGGRDFCPTVGAQRCYSLSKKTTSPNDAFRSCPNIHRGY